MSLEGEVEKLRAQVAKLETGIEPEVIPDESPQPERKRTVVDYWHDEHQRIHGFKPVITGRDAKILFELLATYGNEQLAWIITEYLAGDDPWVRERGYVTPILRGKAQQLSFRWEKSVRMPALQREKAALELKLRDAEKLGGVISMADRIGKRA